LLCSDKLGKLGIRYQIKLGGNPIAIILLCSEIVAVITLVVNEIIVQDRSQNLWTTIIAQINFQLIDVSIMHELLYAS